VKYEFNMEDAFRFARSQGIEVKQSGNELFFKTCPYCKPRATKGNTRTFSISLETGQFKCLRASCGVSGNMVTLSRDFDFSLGMEIDEYYQPRRRFRRLPQGKAPIVPKAPAVQYLESRGISQQIAEQYEITTQRDRDNILVFPFYDERGILQFVKYRKTDFDPAKDGNKEWCERDCKPILFGMKQCKGLERLIVTEGQIDSLSVAAAGLSNAVSVPSGAKGFTWVPYCWDWMRSFEEIVVFGDFEKGSMTLLEDIRKRFPNRIRQVREEDYRGCKDANELLQRYGKEAVRVAVEQAEVAPVARIIPLADVDSVDIYRLPKLQTGISQIDRLLYGGLPYGQVHILAGKRGEGKSTLASQIVGSALNQERKVLAYSGELPNYLFKSWLDFQIAGPQHISEEYQGGRLSRFITKQNQALIDDWYREKAYIYDNRIIEGDEREDLRKTIELAVMQYGIQVVLIDNLMTAIEIDGGQVFDRYDRQSKFIDGLRTLAVRYDLVVLLVAHRRKNSVSRDSNDEVFGSGDITNYAGVILNYERSADLPEEKRRATVTKNRLFGKLELEGYILDYEERSKRIYGQGDDKNASYGWDKTDGFVQVEMEDNPFQ
jgi:archaellum biogenesis ATPase FlaH